MHYVIVYLSTLAILLPLDFAFLGTVGKKMYQSQIGDLMLDTPRLSAAALFYALYLAGIVVFVNGATPSNWASNLAAGALFGLFCYSTFALTNMAILKHWQWALVVPDIAWGMVVTAAAASLGGLLAGFITSRI
ncbi:DUF2177 family protein [Tardiphaga alba]|uniref:DUF2177 family protein n=1 Tax=Tardiphaga alba TaxID=340268 RepID=A0ABX8A6V3_9BRAD|nr:DUF2177 family protein [Tardiphaga alba]QUS39458.1 DUF2177 family protein [Tardiphaga alba]